MGGQKKPTLTKLKKMLTRSARAQRAEEKKRVIFRYNLAGGEEKEILNYISKQKYITPYMLSRKMEIKISKSRSILRKLADEGKLKLVEKNGDFELYIPIAA